MTARPLTPAGPYAVAEQLFASTAEHYIRYRRGYPTVFMDHLAAITNGPVLDLGSGPGLVALELAARGVKVIAVDPNPGMLATGAATADQRGITGIAWHRGDSGHLADLAAGVGAATIGDAFHWMNRPHALSELDRLVAPGGFVAVLGSRAAHTPKPWWEALLDRVRDRHLGPRRLAGAGVLYQDQYGDHETVLRASPFSRITALRGDHPVTYTLDELVGLQYTYAFSSPAALGERRRDFEDDVRAALSAAEPDGVFRAVTQAYLLVAFRA